MEVNEETSKENPGNFLIGQLEATPLSMWRKSVFVDVLPG